jgi:hypothetical protein
MIQTASERRDYAILISLLTREEAEIMASSLRADGVDAFVGNTNHLGMDWHYMIALGGLQIYVPRNRLEDARELVRARLRENADAFPEDRVKRRDRWKLWILVVWHVVPLVVALAIWYFGILANWWDGTGWLGPGVN